MTEAKQLIEATDEVSSDKEERHGNSRTDIIRLSLIALATAVSLPGLGKSFTPVDIIAIVAILLGGYPVFRETFESLRHGQINMEVSMTIAIFASLLLGQFTVSVIITFFVLLSEYIETYAVEKGRQTIVLLEKSTPKRALVRRNGSESEVDVRSLQPNDIVIVRDGERIPVDGTIVAGSAFVNQSTITGESAREEKIQEMVYLPEASMNRESSRSEPRKLEARPYSAKSSNSWRKRRARRLQSRKFQTGLPPCSLNLPSDFPCLHSC